MTTRQCDSRYLCILLCIATLTFIVESVLLVDQLNKLSDHSIFLFDHGKVLFDPTHLVEVCLDRPSIWKPQRTEKFDDVLTTMIRPNYYPTILPLRTVPIWRKGWIAEPVLGSNRTLWATQRTQNLYGYGGNLAFIFSP